VNVHVARFSLKTGVRGFLSGNTTRAQATHRRPKMASTLARLVEFREKLTSLSPASGSAMPFRVVHSSGGAAGIKSVTSEGMGYGLLIAGVAVATQPEASCGWAQEQARAITTPSQVQFITTIS
jgi:hypothetical protein